MAPSKLVCVLMFTVVTLMTRNVEATWCVARSNASPQALQAQLDFACSSGADCEPIQPGGSCFNPNTIQNHASYAFDSYFQRKGKGPGACNFRGTATIAVTDPSYGSCVYPSFQRTNEGANAPSTTPAMNNPNMDSIGPNYNTQNI